MSDIVDVLADFMLRKGPMNIEPLTVRQRLAREILDVLAATPPAVGGEATELSKRLRQQVGDDHARGCAGRCYSCDCGYDLSTEGLLEMAADEIERLAQPASPLRVTDNPLRAYTVEQLQFELAIRATWKGASPPEQPAALPLAVRLRDEAGPSLPQMIAQRRAQLSQEQPAAEREDKNI